MASSAHHQHPRYPLPNTRDEDAPRLPSIKDLVDFDPRLTNSRYGPPLTSTGSIAPADTSISRDIQDNSGRWGRSNVQPQSSASMPAHLQQHQPQHHHQQQHTPPLSAGHEPPHPKNEYPSKPDGAFMTPGMPLSAQSTPVPGSVTIGPGTRGDEGHQSKRRRSSGNMSASRDQRSTHTAYPPHYAPYPPSQPPQQAYQIQAPMSHPGPPVQQPIDHVAAQVAPSPHAAYPTYQPQFPSSRVQHHAAPQQHQAAPGNPYPSAPAHPSHAWDQPHHAPPPHQHQPPPPPQQQPPPAHMPPPPHAPQLQQPSHMPQHTQPLPPQHHHVHPQQTVAPPPLSHHTHHTQPQPQPHQAPPPMQQPQIPYTRTTAIVPIDTRSHYPMAEERMPSIRDSTMTEIMKHCQILFDFASRYAQLQQSMPDVCPSPEELAEMSQRATEVVRLLEEYRRLNLPESERIKMNDVAMSPPDDHRPPKRPWEDMSQDENPALAESTSFAEQQYPTPVDNKMQTTAEQDMEIIRTKRATSTAGASGSGGQPKSKYRKRSRATPPGKCHSCNIRETPEWRRGPDGARTLCNACGLHYAKLQRKRDKQAGSNGELPRIDMETLRASARAAEISDKSHSRSKNTSVRSRQSIEPTSPAETGKPLPQQHHQGSFQLVPMQDPPPSTHSEAPRPASQPQPQPQPQPTMGAPTPPWSTSVQQPPSTVRAYAPDQLQHQSFMRTSHPATNHTPAR